QKGFHSLEEGAEKVLDGIRHRGHQSRKELELLLVTLKPTDLKVLDSPVVKELGARAEKAGEVVRERAEKAEKAVREQAEKAGEVLRKRLDGLQAKVTEVAGGMATRADVRQLTDELNRLTRKVNVLLGREDEAPAAEAKPEEAVKAEAMPDETAAKAEATPETAKADGTPAEATPVEAAPKAGAKPVTASKPSKKKATTQGRH
ncbi:MAG TPA: hypothetical protein VK447_10525, partial [Myxococcaceae bacterium]|nr:hypothetical protein [Myxococcaceae bacterium]